MAAAMVPAATGVAPSDAPSDLTVSWGQAVELWQRCNELMAENAAMAGTVPPGAELLDTHAVRILMGDLVDCSVMLQRHNDVLMYYVGLENDPGAIPPTVADPHMPFRPQHRIAYLESQLFTVRDALECTETVVTSLSQRMQALTGTDDAVYDTLAMADAALANIEAVVPHLSAEALDPHPPSEAGSAVDSSLVSKYISQVEELKMDLEARGEVARALFREKKTLLDDRDAISDALNDAAASLHSLQKSLGQNADALDRMETENSELTARLRTADAERTQLKGKVRAMETELELLMNDDMHDVAAEFEKEMQKQTDDHAAAMDAAAAGYQAERDVLIKDHELRVSEMQVRVDKAREKLERKTADMSELMLELEEARRKLIEAETWWDEHINNLAAGETPPPQRGPSQLPAPPLTHSQRVERSLSMPAVHAGDDPRESLRTIAKSLGELDGVIAGVEPYVALLHTRCTDYEESLDTAEARIRKLEGALSEQELANESLKAQLSASQKEVHQDVRTAQERILGLLDDKEALETRLDEVRGDAATEVDLTKDDLKKAQEKIIAVLNEKGALQQQVDRLSEQARLAAALEEQLEASQVELEAVGAERLALAERVEALEVQADTAVGDAAALRAAVAALEATNATLEAGASEMRATVEDRARSDEAFADATAQIAILQSQNAVLKADLGEASATLDAQRKDLDAQRGELEAAAAQPKAAPLLARIAELEPQLADLEAQLATARQTIDDTAPALAAADGTAESLRGEVARLEAALQEQQQHVGRPSTGSDVDANAAHTQDLEDEIAALKEVEAALNARVAVLEAAAAAVGGADAPALVEELTKARDALAAEVETLEIAGELRKEKIQSLLLEVDEQVAAEAALKDKIAELEAAAIARGPPSSAATAGAGAASVVDAEREELHAHIAELEARVAEYEAHGDDADKHEILQLETALEAQEERNVALETEVETLKEQLDGAVRRAAAATPAEPAATSDDGRAAALQATVDEQDRELAALRVSAEAMLREIQGLEEALTRANATVRENPPAAPAADPQGPSAPRDVDVGTLRAELTDVKAHRDSLLRQLQLVAARDSAASGAARAAVGVDAPAAATTATTTTATEDALRHRLADLETENNRLQVHLDTIEKVLSTVPHHQGGGGEYAAAAKAIPTPAAAPAGEPEDDDDPGARVIALQREVSRLTRANRRMKRLLDDPESSFAVDPAVGAAAAASASPRRTSRRGAAESSPTAMKMTPAQMQQQLSRLAAANQRLLQAVADGEGVETDVAGHSPRPATATPAGRPPRPAAPHTGRGMVRHESTKLTAFADELSTAAASADAVSSSRRSSVMADELQLQHAPSLPETLDAPDAPPPPLEMMSLSEAVASVRRAHDTIRGGEGEADANAGADADADADAHQARTEWTSSEREIERLRQELRVSQAVLARVQRELDALRHAVDAAGDDRTAKLIDELHDTRAELDKATAAVDDLVPKETLARTQLAEALRALGEREEEATALADAVDAAHAELDVLRTALAQDGDDAVLVLGRELERVRRAHDELVSDHHAVAAAAAAAAASPARTAALHDTLHAVRDENVELRSELTLLVERCHEAEAERDRLRERFEEVEGVLVASPATADAAEVAVASPAKGTGSDFDAVAYVRKWRTRCSAVEAERDRLRQQLDRVETAFAAASPTATPSHAQPPQSPVEYMATLRGRCTAVEAERDRYRQQLEVLEATVFRIGGGSPRRGAAAAEGATGDAAQYLGNLRRRCLQAETQRDMYVRLYEKTAAAAASPARDSGASAIHAARDAVRALRKEVVVACAGVGIASAAAGRGGDSDVDAASSVGAPHGGGVAPSEVSIPQTLSAAESPRAGSECSVPLTIALSTVSGMTSVQERLQRRRGSSGAGGVHTSRRFSRVAFPGGRQGEEAAAAAPTGTPAVDAAAVLSAIDDVLAHLEAAATAPPEAAAAAAAAAPAERVPSGSAGVEKVAALTEQCKRLEAANLHLRQLVPAGVGAAVERDSDADGANSAAVTPDEFRDDADMLGGGATAQDAKVVELSGKVTSLERDLAGLAFHNRRMKALLDDSDSSCVLTEDSDGASAPAVSPRRGALESKPTPSGAAAADAVRIQALEAEVDRLSQANRRMKLLLRDPDADADIGADEGPPPRSAYPAAELAEANDALSRKLRDMTSANKRLLAAITGDLAAGAGGGSGDGQLLHEEIMRLQEANAVLSAGKAALETRVAGAQQTNKRLMHALMADGDATAEVVHELAAGTTALSAANAELAADNAALRSANERLRAVVDGMSVAMGSPLRRSPWRSHTAHTHATTSLGTDVARLVEKKRTPAPAAPGPASPPRGTAGAYADLQRANHALQDAVARLEATNTDLESRRTTLETDVASLTGHNKRLWAAVLGDAAPAEVVGSADAPPAVTITALMAKADAAEAKAAQLAQEVAGLERANRRLMRSVVDGDGGESACLSTVGSPMGLARGLRARSASPMAAIPPPGGYGYAAAGVNLRSASESPSVPRTPQRLRTPVNGGGDAPPSAAAALHTAIATNDHLEGVVAELRAEVRRCEDANTVLRTTVAVAEADVGKLSRANKRLLAAVVDGDSDTLHEQITIAVSGGEGYADVVARKTKLEARVRVLEQEAAALRTANRRMKAILQDAEGNFSPRAGMDDVEVREGTPGSHASPSRTRRAPKATDPRVKQLTEEVAKVSAEKQALAAKVETLAAAKQRLMKAVVDGGEVATEAQDTSPASPTPPPATPLSPATQTATHEQLRAANAHLQQRLVKLQKDNARLLRLSMGASDEEEEGSGDAGLQRTNAHLKAEVTRLTQSLTHLKQFVEGADVDVPVAAPNATPLPPPAFDGIHDQHELATLRQTVRRVTSENARLKAVLHDASDDGGGVGDVPDGSNGGAFRAAELESELCKVLLANERLRTLLAVRDDGEMEAVASVADDNSLPPPTVSRMASTASAGVHNARQSEAGLRAENTRLRALLYGGDGKVDADAADADADATATPSSASSAVLHPQRSSLVVDPDAFEQQRSASLLLPPPGIVRTTSRDESGVSAAAGVPPPTVVHVQRSLASLDGEVDRLTTATATLRAFAEHAGDAYAPSGTSRSGRGSRVFGASGTHSVGASDVRDVAAVRREVSLIASTIDQEVARVVDAGEGLRRAVAVPREPSSAMLSVPSIPRTMSAGSYAQELSQLRRASSTLQALVGGAHAAVAGGSRQRASVATSATEAASLTTHGTRGGGARRASVGDELDDEVQRLRATSSSHILEVLGGPPGGREATGVLRAGSRRSTAASYAAADRLESNLAGAAPSGQLAALLERLTRAAGAGARGGGALQQVLQRVLALDQRVISLETKNTSLGDANRRMLGILERTGLLTDPTPTGAWAAVDGTLGSRAGGAASASFATTVSSAARVDAAVHADLERANAALQGSVARLRQVAMVDLVDAPAFIAVLSRYGGGGATTATIAGGGGAADAGARVGTATIELRTDAFPLREVAEDAPEFTRRKIATLEVANRRLLATNRELRRAAVYAAEGGADGSTPQLGVGLDAELRHLEAQVATLDKKCTTLGVVNKRLLRAVETMGVGRGGAAGQQTGATSTPTPAAVLERQLEEAAQANRALTDALRRAVEVGGGGGVDEEGCAGTHPAPASPRTMGEGSSASPRATERKLRKRNTKALDMIADIAAAAEKDAATGLRIAALTARAGALKQLNTRLWAIVEDEEHMKDAPPPAADTAIDQLKAANRAVLHALEACDSAGGLAAGGPLHVADGDAPSIAAAQAKLKRTAHTTTKLVRIVREEWGRRLRLAGADADADAGGNDTIADDDVAGGIDGEVTRLPDDTATAALAETVASLEAELQRTRYAYDALRGQLEPAGEPLRAAWAEDPLLTALATVAARDQEVAGLRAQLREQAEVEAARRDAEEQVAEAVGQLGRMREVLRGYRLRADGGAGDALGEAEEAAADMAARIAQLTHRNAQLEHDVARLKTMNHSLREAVAASPSGLPQVDDVHRGAAGYADVANYNYSHAPTQTPPGVPRFTSIPVDAPQAVVPGSGSPWHADPELMRPVVPHRSQSRSPSPPRGGGGGVRPGATREELLTYIAQLEEEALALRRRARRAVDHAVDTADVDDDNARLHGENLRLRGALRQARVAAAELQQQLAVPRVPPRPGGTLEDLTELRGEVRRLRNRCGAHFAAVHGMVAALAAATHQRHRQRSWTRWVTWALRGGRRRAAATTAPARAGGAMPVTGLLARYHTRGILSRYYSLWRGWLVQRAVKSYTTAAQAATRQIRSTKLRVRGGMSRALAALRESSAMRAAYIYLAAHAAMRRHAREAVVLKTSGVDDELQGIRDTAAAAVRSTQEAAAHAMESTRSLGAAGVLWARWCARARTRAVGRGVLGLQAQVQAMCSEVSATATAAQGIAHGSDAAELRERSERAVLRSMELERDLVQVSLRTGELEEELRHERRRYRSLSRECGGRGPSTPRQWACLGSPSPSPRDPDALREAMTGSPPPDRLNEMASVLHTLADELTGSPRRGAHTTPKRRTTNNTSSLRRRQGKAVYSLQPTGSGGPIHGGPSFRAPAKIALAPTYGQANPGWKTT